MKDGQGLRILHTEASRGWGGQEIRVLSELAEFAARGHSVALAADPDSNIAAEARRRGIETHLIVMKKNIRAIRDMRSLFRSWKPDVVNVHSSIDHWLSAAARLRLPGRPAIVKTRHISAPVNRNLPTRWLYNKGADFVMTTAESIADALTADGFLPKARVRSVPTGMDIDRFCPGDRKAVRETLGLGAEDYIIGIVATLRSWKGHADLLEAFARPETGAARLVIVGDGPQEENILRKIEELGLGERVMLTGRRPDPEIWFRAFDMAALPSYANEGVPQALLQAMAAELPIVATPVGGIPEVAGDLAAVRMCRPRDPASLAAAIADLIANPPCAADRAALRARVAERHSTEIMVKGVTESFAAAMARAKAG